MGALFRDLFSWPQIKYLKYLITWEGMFFVAISLNGTKIPVAQGGGFMMLIIIVLIPVKLLTRAICRAHVKKKDFLYWYVEHPIGSLLSPILKLCVFLAQEAFVIAVGYSASTGRKAKQDDLPYIFIFLERPIFWVLTPLVKLSFFFLVQQGIIIAVGFSMMAILRVQMDGSFCFHPYGPLLPNHYRNTWDHGTRAFHHQQDLWQ